MLWSQGDKYTFWRRSTATRKSTRAPRGAHRDQADLAQDLPAGVLTYAEQRALEIGITMAGGAA